jgi:hypothetical protein
MSEAVPTPDVPLVVCDANVFYAIVMTDLILSLGVNELIRPRWTQHIHEEWIRNLRANRPDLDPAKIERRRQQMDAAIDDCLIDGYEGLIPQPSLPDPDDRHVLAAAIHAQVSVILTYNRRHSPRRVVSPYEITVHILMIFFRHLCSSSPPRCKRHWRKCGHARTDLRCHRQNC